MAFFGLGVLLLAACGPDSDGAAQSTVELHACDLLPGTEVSRIAGAAFIESNVDSERSAGSDAFSQCTHTLEPPRKRVTVQVRRSGAPMAMSKQVDADLLRTSDDSSGYSIKLAEAIDAGTDINGLGDVAYAFEMDETLFVVAYVDKHYEVRVWTPIGSESREQMLRIDQEIVQAVIDRL
jgi:hypothetical protein